MSAINTAAIGSPAGAHHLLGNQSHRHYSPELDEFPNRRQGLHNLDVSSSGTIPASLGDHMWTTGRESGASGAMAFSQVYNQPFQQSPAFDVRHMNQYAVGQYGQLAANLPGVVGGSIPTLHNTTSSVSQPDARGANHPDREGHGSNWSENFQGLSLGQ